MSFKEMVDFVESAWPARSYIVPCLVGPPGIGKTAAVREFARKLSLEDGTEHHVVVINAQRCIPSEVISMTMPDEENRTMVLYNSATLTSLRDGDILFLDELWEAHPNVLSVLLTLIESRIMADGTPLPDIMIVAATNATVPPGQLPLNIRQRFVSMTFKIAREDTARYIKSTFDVDISSVHHLMTCEGDGYNVLTPRSMTKMVRWLVDTPEEDRANVASTIDKIWQSRLGTTLAKLVGKKVVSHEQQLRNAVIDIYGGHWVITSSDESINFENCTLDEMFEFLQKLPDWEETKKKLMQIELEDPKEVNEDIKF